VVLGPEYDPYIVPQYSLTPQRTELLQLKPVEDRLLDTVKPQKLQWLLVCLAVPGLAQCGEYSVEPAGWVDRLRVDERYTAWPQRVEQYAAAHTLPHVLVLLHGTQVDSSWTVEALVAHAQGAVWRRTTWYSRASFEYHFTYNKTSRVEWPLALPVVGSVTVPKAVVTHNNSKARPAIHQTWKSWAQLGETKRRNVEHVRALNQERAHWLWSDEACRELVAENFDVRLLEVYEDLIPGAFRADVWRLCVLYAFGGTYLDIDLDLFQPLANFCPEWCDLTLCQDDVRSVPGDNLYLYNAFIDAPAAGHPFFRFALVRVLAHVRATRQRGVAGIPNSLFPTGPCAFGLAFEDTGWHPAKHVHLYVTNERVPGADRNIRSRLTGEVVANTKFPKAGAEEGIGAYDALKSYFRSEEQPHAAAQPPARSPRVYDVFVYSGGDPAVLKLRLETLRGLVTHTVVVEKHGSEPSAARGLTAADCAQVVSVQVLPGGACKESEGGVDYDAAFKAALVRVNVQDDDYVIFGEDLDLPDPAAVRRVVAAREPGRVFQPHWFYGTFAHYLGPWKNAQLNVATLHSYRAHSNGRFRLHHLHRFLPCEVSGWRVVPCRVPTTGSEQFFGEHGVPKALQYWGRFPAAAGPERFGVEGGSAALHPARVACVTSLPESALGSPPTQLQLAVLEDSSKSSKQPLQCSELRLRLADTYDRGGWSVAAGTDVVRPFAAFPRAPNLDLYAALAPNEGTLGTAVWFAQPHHPVFKRVLHELRTAEPHETQTVGRLLYCALQKYLDAADALRPGTYALSNGRTVQLDEEVFVQQAGAYALAQRERGVLAWTSSPGG
jgi:hypothetical protein